MAQQIETGLCLSRPDRLSADVPRNRGRALKTKPGGKPEKLCYKLVCLSIQDLRGLILTARRLTLKSTISFLIQFVLFIVTKEAKRIKCHFEISQGQR